MSERNYERINDLPEGITPVTGAELVELEQDGVSRKFSMTALAGITNPHEETHQRGGADEIGTLDNDAYGIPYLDADGLIDSRVSDASTTKKGKVQLATSGEVSATKAVAGTDARLSDARTPTAHASQHIAGTDVIADATVSNSGLMSATDKVKADATTPAYIPTEDQKAALAGSYGTPGDTNRYVTEDDIGVGVCPLESGLVPSSNLPSYVDDVLEYANEAAFPAIGETGKIYVALDVNLTFRWSGSTYVEISKSLALGTTSSTAHRGDHGVTAYNHSQEIGNPHGTKPSELSSLGEGWGTLLESDSNDRLPTSDQKAALVGTSGTPSASNPFVTTTDPRLAGGGGDGTTDALVRAWASFFSVFSEEQPTGQTPRYWFALASHDGDLYAADHGGDIYKMDGAGIFQPTGQTTRQWFALASHDGDLYAAVYGGDIYKMDGAGIFQPTGQTSKSWYGIASHDGDLYATVDYGDIYLLTTSNPSVNISKSNYTVPISSSFPINGRKVYRRTSAYDGDPVTITPPSGATFEGRASIDLYGQYSYVELERISATVFAIKDLKDEYVWDAGTGARIRRRWGQLSEKEIIGTTAATANAAVNLAHGLDLTKIVSFTGMVRTPTDKIPMHYTSYGDFKQTVSLYCDATKVFVLNSTVLLERYFSQPFTVVIHYREW